MAKKKRGDKPVPVRETAHTPAAGAAKTGPVPAGPEPKGPSPKGAGKPGPAKADAAAGKKSLWKSGADLVVLLAGAVLVALAIKAYAFDVYLIPSGSMETVLHGRPDGGDRILCSKLSYRWRQPERWEIAVFEFPYESARRNDFYNISAQYEGQNFVKRIVGLPGETLAIARGDIWTRPESEREYRRVVKPDSVQRGMWQKVYRENFSDIALTELEQFWKIIGGETALVRGGPLVLRAGDETVRMDYRPVVPAGERRDVMVELPGIPDRYVLEQPVQFRCPNVLEDGQPCGHVYVRSVETHNIVGRCPRCGALNNETAVIFYHRRSGLPGVGRYGVSPTHAPQGEDVGPRQADYHFVPDLRIVAGVVLENDATGIAFTIRDENRYVQAVVSGDGRAELRVNGAPAEATRRHLAPVVPGRRHRVEFYLVDGAARLFIDSTADPVLDEQVWDDRRPAPRSLPRASGVSLVAAGGDVRVESVAIDRDIFYYSGWEQDRGERFPQVGPSGEVFISQNAFFPMGDHTVSSFDARSWGPVNLGLLRGPALAIWWPPERIQRIQ
ncbi:MAG: signal peptidase I [Planctomycetaceae bacterium]|nr:signal peptidase I [Planctomycetaceae bacterium]